MEVALYYGFTPTVQPVIEQIDKDCVRKLFEEELASKHQIDPSFKYPPKRKRALKIL